MQPQIFIHLKDGTIQDIYADINSIVTVIDEDTESDDLKISFGDIYPLASMTQLPDSIQAALRDHVNVPFNPDKSERIPHGTV